MFFNSKKVDIEDIDATPYPERLFTLLSLIFSLCSVVLTGWNVLVPKLPAELLLAKDMAIYGTLIILTLFFFMRYRQVLTSKLQQKMMLNKQLTEIRNLINSQTALYQDLMNKTKVSFFKGLGEDIYSNRFNYRTPGLNNILTESMESVLASVLQILKNQLEAQTGHEKHQLSLSVKALVKGSMAKSLCELSEDKAATIKNEKRYIITLGRDYDARSKREVRMTVYEENENTDFLRILTGEVDYYHSNDLTAERHYRNQNPEWQKQYNSTLVVPIWIHRPAHPEPEFYGFFTVDSPNKNKINLFTEEETKPIMIFGADLLALIFLFLEMYDNLPEELKKNGKFFSEQPTITQQDI